MSSAQNMGAHVTGQYLKICNDIGCQPMPDLLAGLTADQRFCSITSPTENLPDGQVIALCAVLPLSSFELCSFHNLSLSVNSWAAIADACSKTRTLQRLVFKDCSFKDGQGLPMFSRALASADLQSLELVNCQLGDDFVAGLVDGSLLSSEKFSTLRLAGCGLGDMGAVRLAKAVEAVGMMSSLRTLDLSHNRIGDSGAMALAAMLTSDAQSSSVPLNSLELEGNQLSDAGGLALCKAAKAALMLQRLNLSLNPRLTGATMLAMAEAIRFNTGTLKEVALAGCRAGEDAAVALLRAAHRNTTLQLLDIRGVPLGPEGVAHLCALLRYTNTLNTLRVDVSSTEGAEAIARDLPNNRSLVHITLGGPVPDGLLAAMSETLAANTVRKLSPPPAASPHIHAWIEDSTNAFQPIRTSIVLDQHSPSSTAPPASGTPATAQPQPQPQPQSQPHAHHHHQHVHHQQHLHSAPRSRSPSPPPPEYARSPRSEAGGSVYSHATHKTGRTHRTHRTNASYLSFSGFTDMSRKTVMIGSTPLRVSASLAAGGAAEKAALIFRKHDLNDDNSLDREEMLAALDEMGVLHGIKAKHIGRFLDSEFKKADWDKDGRISLQDFIVYYEKIAYYQTQLAREGRINSMANLNKQMVPAGVERNAHLKRVFKNYARLPMGQGRVYTDGVPQMNSSQFHRLCQDAGFMEPEGRLSTTALDVILTRYRSPGTRRLGFRNFIDTLAALAYEMGFQFDDILEVLGAAKSSAPMTPTGSAQKESMSDAGGAAGLGHDPSFDVGGVPLATVYEGKGKSTSQGGKAKGAKKAPSTKSGASRSAAGSRNTTIGGTAHQNPLYDTSAPTRSAVPAAQRARGNSSPGRTSGSGGPLPQPQSYDLAVVEARVRMEMEAQLRQMEERMERQVSAAARSAVAAAVAVPSGSPSAASGAAASADAMTGAKLVHLQGQVSNVMQRQDELASVSQQMASLQDILNKLAEEMVRIRNRADSAANAAAAATAAAEAARSGAGGGSGGGDAAEVEEKVAGLAEELAEVQEGSAAAAAKAEELASLLTAVRQQQQQQAAALAALQQQVAALPSTGAVAAAAAQAETLVASLEKRLADRFSRYDGALLQVAKQVDALDQRLREEQEGNMKTLEMLLAAAGAQGAVDAGGAAAGGSGSGEAEETSEA